MKKLFCFFAVPLLILSSCDILDNDSDDDDTIVMEHYGMVSRIDVKANYEGGVEYFLSILCFSYDDSGNVDSFTVLYPSENTGLIEESVSYGLDLGETSLALSYENRMLLYDGVDSEHAVGEETDRDSYDGITVSDECVQAAKEYEGPALSYSSLKYEYDDDFHLTSVVDENDDFGNMTFEWDDGNMVRFTKAVHNSLKANLTYTEYEAPSYLGNFLMDFIFNVFDDFSSPWIFYTGKPSENLPASISFRESDSVDYYSADMNFDYLFEGGLLTSMTCNYSDGYDNMDFVLTFYYDKHDPDSFPWVPVK